METIFTLNVRDHVLLPVIRDHFKLNSTVLHREIHALHQETIQVLNSKGINYKALRSALTPAADKNEAGFIFDSTAIKSSMYGRDVMNQLLPLLDRRSSHSVLHGDLLGKDQQIIYDIISDAMVMSRPYTFIHSSLLFCVYINNLSDAALTNIHEKLQSYGPYIGYIPATFASNAKTYLSTTIGGAFLKYQSTIIIGHEDDRPQEENVNLSLYPFEKHGYDVLSIRSINYSLFLNYKIERSLFEINENDASLSINALSNMIIPLHECDVQLDIAKHGYLTTDKLGKLTKGGMASMSCEELSAMIKLKITSNYIYGLTYLTEHDVMKFNIMLEIPHSNGGYPTKIVVALEYLPKEKLVRVITLY